jgi:23S rRNA (uracil1939-C5)-methyltransferase
VFKTKITAITNEGFGVGKHEGITLFVPHTAVGDYVEVKAVKIAKQFVYCKLIKIVTPSADRIDNDCRAFPQCGGCDFRHISYQAELRAKEQFIRDAFERIGKVSHSTEFMPIISVGIKESLRYRNKAQYPVGKDEYGRAVAGFYSRRSHRIVPHVDCKLHAEIFSRVKNYITDYIRANRLSVYDENTHSGVIRHICLRQNSRGDLNVCIVARRKIPEFTKLAHILVKEFTEIKGVVLNINTEKTNVVFGDSETVLHGESDLIDTISGLEIILSPRSFYQVNTKAAEELYKTAANFAGLTPTTSDSLAKLTEDSGDNQSKLTPLLLDLYCGIGVIGLSMSGSVSKVVGVDSEESSILNAVENAKRNNIQNAEFFCCDAKEFSEKSALIDNQRAIAVLDPNRKGCDIEVLENIARLNPARIVMVSCNPATAARDCARLAEHGYETLRVVGVDMFPRTRHVECVALLDRRENLDNN